VRPAPLHPRPDGLLSTDRLPAFPIMAPRLQGELTPQGVLTLSIWGNGEVGRLRIEGLEGPLAVAPNRIEGHGGTGLFVAQTAPVMALRGARPLGVKPTGFGALRVEARPGGWLIAAGADAGEAAAALRLGLEDVACEAHGHARRCDLLPSADPLLRSLVIQGAHAALSSVRKDERGRFAGLSAGLAYSNPPRSYFRDGYWTLQLLQQIAPEVVADEIELLATCVHDDGEAPSGVIVQGSHADAFEQRRLRDADLAAIHTRPCEWWSDHFDSPLFFVLAVGDHAAATGDMTLARRHWPKLRAVFRRYMALRGADGLPVKPRNDRDWADNVFRDGLVAYDLGLWVGALDALSRLGAAAEPDLGAEASREATAARAAIGRTLWRGRGYVDYLRPDGWAEPHAALDALTVLRFAVAPDDEAATMLDDVRARLESRHNPRQRYGDFGMLCAWPTFADRSALRGKTAFPYRYHNGGDWPWLDGLYAAERLRRDLGGWRYPLTRWWETCLERGWAGAVEHFSPAYGRGSLLQAWSSLPAAVALQYAEQVLAGDPDAV
jgi:hypothetical protein